jgi:exopolyphosphatase/guanosine-5'-triphosphate,3'-diphosphate pyrophosphatase
MRIAVLDLGTNVFNMILSEFTPQGGCKSVKEYKCAAKLGAGGLSNGLIAPTAFETATAALDKIMAAIEEAGGADKIIPYATSAVRDASNGLEFANFLNARYGFEIRIIPGERDAQLIFKGIMESVGHLRGSDGKFATGENALMLDIGGGSNEFIITDGEQILWKRSFPIGMARMREKFAYEDPIPQEVVEEFIRFNEEVLVELWEMVEKFGPRIFIGSSGSFDTFKDLIFNCGYGELPSIELAMEDLIKLDDTLVASLASERLQMPGMSPIRVDYIVLASIFTRYVLEKLQPRIVYQSSFSLKEGGMKEEFDNYLNSKI